MKIVYVTQRLPFGLGESFVVPEINALLEAGHEVLVVPRLSSDPVVHDDVGPIFSRTRRLPDVLGILAAAGVALVRHPRRTARAFWRLRLSRPRRRVLYNAMATAQGVWIARLAREWGAEHIHAHWAHLTATMAMSASELSGIPWSFTAHRYDVVLNNLLDAKLRSARFGRFISRQMLEIAGRFLTPEARRRAVVMHMGVVLPGSPARAGNAHTTPVVLCPASLAPVKGHRHLLAAAARLAGRGVPFEVWLAGDGPEADEIARQIGREGLTDRVRLLGHVPHHELLDLYQCGAVQCVVLPSLDLGGGLHEGISVAAIEAMAHGLPVISTRTGGMPELLEDGAGILVPPADDAALAEALGRVLGSTSTRAELGRAGRQRIADAFDVAAIGAELVRRFAGEREHLTPAPGARAWTAAGADA